ncbi:MAG: 3'-5' exonuclease [Idiomarina sp.]|nr:3'-5' exonuclease [Idiomarina sp.]
MLSVIVFAAVLLWAIYRFNRSADGSEILSPVGAAFVAVDLETTGLNPESDEIIEIAACKVTDGDLNRVEQYSTLIRVRKVPSRIQRLTGITQQMVDEEGIALELAIREVLSFIGDSKVVAHNANFDIRFIQNAADKVGVEFCNEVECTLKMAREMLDLENYKLATVAKAVGYKGEPNHRALEDAQATCVIYKQLTSFKG